MEAWVYDVVDAGSGESGERERNRDGNRDLWSDFYVQGSGDVRLWYFKEVTAKVPFVERKGGRVYEGRGIHITCIRNYNVPYKVDSTGEMDWF